MRTLLLVSLLFASCKGHHSATVDAGTEGANVAPINSATASGLPERSSRTYGGTIGRAAVREMHLTRDGSNVTGNYRYVSTGAPIALSGTADDAGSVSLTETTNGKPTGAFHGAIGADGSFRGAWSDEARTRSLPFILRELGQPPAAPGDASRTCNRVAKSAVSRYGATGTVLEDGRVLLAGSAVHDAEGPYSPVVEIFDPTTSALTKRAPMGVGRAKHSATLLDDGRVLVVGGFSDEPKQAFSRTAEVYEVARDRWTRIAPVPESGVRMGIARLADGRVMLAGGDLMIKAAKLAQTLLLDPKTLLWASAPDAPHTRAGNLSPLADGRMLFAGDTMDWNGNETPELDVFDPRGPGAWSSLPGPPDAAVYQEAVVVSATSIALFGRADGDGGPVPRALLVDGVLQHPREIPSPFEGGGESTAFAVDGGLYARQGQTLLRWDEAAHSWRLMSDLEADDCSTTIPLPRRANGRPRVLFAGTCGGGGSDLEICEL